jgi:hypothetical protein
MSGGKVTESMLTGMSASDLSRASNNMMPYEEIHELINDLIETLERLQPTDPAGHSETSQREKQFIACLAGIKDQLDATWQSLKSYCEKKTIDVAFRPRQLDPDERKRIESALKGAFSLIGWNLSRPADALIDEALQVKANPAQTANLPRPQSAAGKGLVQKDQLASIHTELVARGTVNRELLQELLGSSLIHAGHKAVDTTTQKVIDGITRLPIADQLLLIKPLLEALRKDADGEDYKEELLVAILNINKAAPELKQPAGFQDLWKCSTPQQAADAIDDVARLFRKPRNDRMFKSLVQDQLKPSSGFTWEGAQKFLKISDQVTLTGKSKLVRDAIAEYVAWPRS